MGCLGHGLQASGVQCGPHSETACQFCSEVGKDISKHVRGHNHIEFLRFTDQKRGNGIDMEIVDDDFWKIPGNLFAAFQEKPVGGSKHVRFVDETDFFLPDHRQLEGGSGDPFAGIPGKDSHREGGVRMRHELSNSQMHVAVGIKPFGVFPDDDQIEVLPGISQPLDRSGRTDVCIKIKMLADRSARIQGLLKRFRIGGRVMRAHHPGITFFQFIQGFLRKRRLILLKGLPTHRKFYPFQRSLKMLSQGFIQNPICGFTDLWANPVRRHDSDAIGFQRRVRQLVPWVK